jgi:hypothetical protein
MVDLGRKKRRKKGVFFFAKSKKLFFIRAAADYKLQMCLKSTQRSTQPYSRDPMSVKQTN